MSVQCGDHIGCRIETVVAVDHFHRDQTHRRQRAARCDRAVAADDASDIRAVAMIVLRGARAGLAAAAVGATAGADGAETLLADDPRAQIEVIGIDTGIDDADFHPRAADAERRELMHLIQHRRLVRCDRVAGTADIQIDPGHASIAVQRRQRRRVRLQHERRHPLEATHDFSACPRGQCRQHRVDTGAHARMQFRRGIGFPRDAIRGLAAFNRAIAQHDEDADLTVPLRLLQCGGGYPLRPRRKRDERDCDAERTRDSDRSHDSP
jgi:hypothetical protein